MVKAQMDDPPQFSASDLAEFDVSASETPDSRSIFKTFENLREEIIEALKDTKWGHRYIWKENFNTPYIGPDSPRESTYVWLGFVEEYYKDLPRRSNALQLEFGIDAGSATGFLDQDVIWGILLGPWANDEVVETIQGNLQEYSSLFAQFLADHDDYILVTKNDTFEAPSEGQIRSITDDIDQGLAVTRDLELTDLPDLDIFPAACETLSQLTPLYRTLSGINNAPPVTSLLQTSEEISQDPAPPTSTLDVDSLAAATTLDAEDIQDAVERLTSSECSNEEAIGYVQRYLTEMLQGNGLFAVRGIGPAKGRALVEAGVTTVEDLQKATPDDLSKKSSLSVSQIQRLQESVQADDFTSLDPDDEQVAEHLVNSADGLPVEDNESERSEYKEENGRKKAAHAQRSNTSSTEPQGDPEITASTADEDQQEVLTPSELPVPSRDTSTMPDGDEVFPNYLSEYYESFRNARRVLELVFQIPGTDIEPDDRRDPRVQYYVLLDACVGFGDTSSTFTGYGPQHQDRLSFSIRDYRKVFGDAETVTNYQLINVKPFDKDTHELLYEKTNVKITNEFVRPCVPGTSYPLPELPDTLEGLQEALRRLDTFPAYPPLPTENGISDRTIPIAEIYQTCFEDLDREYKVDLSPLTATEPAPTGPVPAATPTSSSEAESTLLDYGRLSHLFRRVNPPAESPANRALNIFALDWYRPDSPSFEALRALAKHDKDDPVDAFRPRLQDLLHRRFLLDTWDYDYITVFPGHEAGSLSPQLVELAQDAVIETDILYTPLLERTETVERQREKSKDERQRIAIEPSKSLQTRAKLNGDTVILFDDVCTTGSSFLAGAHLLRQAGADRVVCLSLGLTSSGPQANVKEITDPEVPASEIIAGMKR